MSPPASRLPNILLDGDRRLDAFAAAEGGARPLVVLGWREWVQIPEFGIARIAAKLDSGARTSALHADRIEVIGREGNERVRFHVVGERLPGEGAADPPPLHEAPLVGRRSVRSSNGETEVRCVIAAALVVAGRTFATELTLTNRAGMELPMLIGRAALAGRALIDPERSWTWEKPVAKAGPRRRVRRKAEGG